MRVVGWPFSATVASAIAFISLIPTSTAAVNQIPNCLIGSGSRSMRRKPWVKYSSRKATRSCGKSTPAKISRRDQPLKAERVLPLGWLGPYMLYAARYFCLSLCQRSRGGCSTGILPVGPPDILSGVSYAAGEHAFDRDSAGETPAVPTDKMSVLPLQLRAERVSQPFHRALP